MLKFKIGVLITALVATPLFADVNPKSANCDKIAELCKSAGYSHAESVKKNFWYSCLRPILLNKTVKNINVDAKTVKACRKDKIEQLNDELKDLNNAN